jgi:hypothetical protein
MATVAPALLVQGRIERTGGTEHTVEPTGGTERAVEPTGGTERAIEPTEGTLRTESTGAVEPTGGAVNLVAAALRPLQVAAVPSRDFR